MSIYQYNEIIRPFLLPISLKLYRLFQGERADRSTEQVIPLITLASFGSGLCTTRLWWGVLHTTLCDKVCQWLVTGRWFSPGTPVSSTNKTGRPCITNIKLSHCLILFNKYSYKKIHMDPLVTNPVISHEVPVATNILSSNPVHGKIYSIQHYVIKFVSDLQ
jgi:hypothetical protein